MQMDKKYFEEYSLSLTIREIEIKSTLRFHLTPVIWAKIKKIKDSKCW